MLSSLEVREAFNREKMWIFQNPIFFACLDEYDHHFQHLVPGDIQTGPHHALNLRLCFYNLRLCLL